MAHFTSVKKKIADFFFLEFQCVNQTLSHSKTYWKEQREKLKKERKIEKKN